MSESTALAVVQAEPVEVAKAAELMKRASDVAGVCREIVLATAQDIKGKKHVKVEGWRSIAMAHGCAISTGEVRAEGNGFVSVGEVRRISDNKLVAKAEGYCGRDEAKWKNEPEFAIRAMAQTRAASRAGRTAFDYVVVMMNAGLSTTPAEEMEAVVDQQHAAPPPPSGTAGLKAKLKAAPAAPPEPPPHTDAEFVADAPKASPPRKRLVVQDVPSEGRPPPVTFRFAACKGKTSHEVSDKDITWYIERAQEAVNDPERARFIGSNTAELKALQAEQAWRAAQ